MHRFSLIIAMVPIIGCLGTEIGATQAVRVNADRVNLRARPSLQSETIAQAGTGDRLTARQIGDDWVEVHPPADVAFFVHADFVRDGVVDVARLNVRAGPGINYSDMGTLTRGDRLTVIGEFSDWLKIKPPAGSSVWVSREFVDIPRTEPPRPEPEPTPSPEPAPPRPSPPDPVRPAPTPAPPEPQPSPKPAPAPPAPAATPPPTTAPAPRPIPAPEPTPPQRTPAVVLSPPPPPVPPAPRPTPQPAPTPGKIERDTAPPAALQRMGLVPLPGQGRAATYEGVLTRGSFLLIRPSRYRIINRGPGRVITLCYVMGNHAQLDSLDGEEIRVHGREYWVQGVRQPILVVERIERN